MKRWELSMILAAVLIIGCTQIFYGISTSPKHIDYDNRPPQMTRSSQILTPSTEIKASSSLHTIPVPMLIEPPLSPHDSFGACLMMKEDNDLLSEWIAYHYMILPLRYLFVGSDSGNTQNPRTVLDRWNDTDLSYWVMEDTQFINRHGPIPTWGPDENPAHHGFIHRQRGFITACSEFMKAQNMTWVSFHDSDEFIVLNHFTPEDDEGRQAARESNSTDATRYAMRERLQGASTVLEAIRNVNQIQALKPCYTMPRVLFGSLENVTCPDAVEVTELAKRDYDYLQMSTLRFKQRAPKGDFKTGRFGKVFVDLSRMSDVSIPPKNVHRPFKPACDHPSPAIQTSLFYINHYVGSWERYSSRLDDRRSCTAWMRRAYFDQGHSCEQRIHEWFPKFVLKMGTEQAKYLLGVVDQNRRTGVPPTREELQCPPLVTPAGAEDT